MASVLRPLAWVAALACFAGAAALPASAETQGITQKQAESLAQVMPRSELAAQSIYFVLTDRYANGSRDNDFGGGQSVGGFDPSSIVGFHGGDFVGMAANLDRLRRLGFTAIWITPPFVQNAVQGGSSAFHGYWGIDFTTVDPHLGTEAEFKAFVDKAHSMGIDVIIDIVLNHTGDVIQYREGSSFVTTTTRPYRDARGNVVDLASVAGKPACSPQRETDCFPEFNLASFPKTPFIPAGSPTKKPVWLNDLKLYHNRGDATACGWAAGECAEMGDFIGLDDIMTEHPTVIQGWADAMGEWIRKYGIDGFRIDTAKHVDPAFFEAWVPLLMQHARDAGKPDFYMFGEAWDYGFESLSTYVRDRDLPSVLDFPMQRMVVEFASGKRSGNGLVRQFAKDDYFNAGERPDGIVRNAYSLATFLGNHDMGRVGNLIRTESGATGKGLLDRVRLAHSVLFLMRGAPVVYYGDEVGMAGRGGDAAARQDMFPTQVAEWRTEERVGSSPIGSGSSLTAAAERHPMAVHIAALSRLRSTYPALVSGALVTRESVNGAAAWSRISASERREFIVVVNSGDRAQRLRITTSTPSSKFVGVFGGTGIARSSAAGALTISVPPRGAVVYRAASLLPRTPAAPAPTAEAYFELVLGTPVLKATVEGTRDPLSITFAARECSTCAWERLGTDDAPPYLLPIPRGAIDTTKPFEFVAISRTSDARIAPGAVIRVTPDDLSY